MRYIENGNVTLAIETRGEGPRHLLFAHGWISSRRMWYDVVDRLDPRRYTAHLLDFRGAGLSDRPTDGHDLEGRLRLPPGDRPLPASRDAPDRGPGGHGTAGRRCSRRPA